MGLCELLAPRPDEDGYVALAAADAAEQGADRDAILAAAIATRERAL